MFSDIYHVIFPRKRHHKVLPNRQRNRRQCKKARAGIMYFVGIFPKFILDFNKVIYHQIELRVSFFPETRKIEALQKMYKK